MVPHLEEMVRCDEVGTTWEICQIDRKKCVFMRATCSHDCRTWLGGTIATAVSPMSFPGWGSLADGESILELGIDVLLDSTGVVPKDMLEKSVVPG